MAYFFSPLGNSQIIDANGDPLVGGTIETYLAGTSTPETTYTDDTGGTAQGVVMTLNSLGLPTNGPVWLLGGVPLKFIIKNALGVTQSTFDDVSGIGDTASVTDEWLLYGAAPTYISATSFSLVGDQTNTFQVARRLKSTNTGGTVYSTITASAFAAGVTTVTVSNTSGVLDSGLSAVSYGLLAAINPSVPAIYAKPGANTDITSLPGLTTPISLIALRSYISGCTLSTAGSSATMSIAAGAAMDSTNAYLMQLSAIAKTTSAWTVGTAQGGLDTGAIANSTWYHFFVIRRPDTGVVDVLFSLSATAPTMPANYTQFRRIGSGFTNGSAQWTLFKQFGDWFDWDTSIKDVEASNPGSAAVTSTLSVPTGVSVIARVNAGVNNSGAAVGAGLYLSALDTADLAASTSAAPLWGSGGVAFNSSGGVLQSFTQQSVKTNTSAQIRSRAAASDGSVTVRIATLGWIDTRGRDA